MLYAALSTQSSVLVAAIDLRPGGILAWIVVGLLAGWLAGLITRAEGFGCFGNIVIGLLGAAIGGLLFSLFGVTDRAGFWGSVAVATLGAIVLLAIARVAGRPRR
ncbi:MAG: GlsB/YeaQ/YmgE family stress response membrane protein [Thermomicrobiales bacterium]